MTPSRLPGIAFGATCRLERSLSPSAREPTLRRPRGTASWDTDHPKWIAVGRSRSVPGHSETARSFWTKKAMGIA